LQYDHDFKQVRYITLPDELKDDPKGIRCSWLASSKCTWFI